MAALTGWSLRHAIAEAVAPRFGIGPGAGSLHRLCDKLARAGLWRSQVVSLAGKLQVALVSLTDLGRDVVAACGIPTVASEWERLLACPAGPPPAGEIALVCALAYHARIRGYISEVCPQALLPVVPDLLLRRGEEKIYVAAAVQMEMARPDLWRQLADHQGFVALGGLDAAGRERLVAAAKSASPHGKATDLETLLQERGGAELWVEEW